MADVQDVLALAHKLGEAIASNPKVAAYVTSQDAVQKDEVAQELLKDYRETAGRIQRLEHEGKPIEPADKRKLAECEQGMASNSTLKAWMRAQADYVELMQQVNQAMEAPLGRLRESGG